MQMVWRLSCPHHGTNAIASSVSRKALGSRSATCPEDISAGAELVCVVPRANVAGLNPDDDIGSAERLHVRGAIFWAFIPGHDAQRGLGHALLDKARTPPDLDRAQWRV